MYGNEVGQKQAYADAAGAVREEPQVGVQLQRLERAISELDGACSDLCGRLSSVQSPGGSANKESAGHPEPILSPLAAMLRQQTERINRLTATLATNSDLLEI